MLGLIIKDNGGNLLIEAKRSKLYQEPSPEVEDLDEETTRCAADNDNLTPEDTNRRDQGPD